MAQHSRDQGGRQHRSVFVTGDTMKVNSTEFGSITIDGETYHHDVLIRLSGKIEKRKKKLSKKQFGTSHIMSLEEAEFVQEKGSELLVLGTGQNDNVRLSPEAAAFFARKGCEVLAEATPQAAATFNRAKGRRIGLFHVTC
ncbi:MAG TPA: MTH938/NDUFAF3 family protein [Myxococcota bacterium]|nr:MTH938/NDUFAF3 family protein [Myxococcota bacterium]